MAESVDRDALFKAFGRAWFKRDMELLYQVVTPDFVWASHDGTTVVRITGREAVARQFERMAAERTGVRFHDVAYHHAPDTSFMTFRMTATETATGRPIEAVGIERYTFRDGRIALKDVFMKPVASAA